MELALESRSHPATEGTEQPGGKNESPLSLRNGDRESQLWQDNASRPAKHG